MKTRVKQSMQCEERKEKKIFYGAYSVYISLVIVSQVYCNYHSNVCIFFEGIHYDQTF
jgi:hypothetical protein